MRNAAKVQETEFGRYRYFEEKFARYKKQPKVVLALGGRRRPPCAGNGTQPTSAQRGTQPRV